MKLFALVFCGIVLAGCAPSQPTNSGVYMLVDTSGTYRDEIEKAEQIIRYTLSRLDAADTFAVARVDTGSFSEKDIIAKVTFDDRPSTVNRQKRLFAEQALRKMVSFACLKSSVTSGTDPGFRPMSCHSM